MLKTFRHIGAVSDESLLKRFRESTVLRFHDIVQNGEDDMTIKYCCIGKLFNLLVHENLSVMESLLSLQFFLFVSDH